MTPGASGNPSVSRPTENADRPAPESDAVRKDAPPSLNSSGNRDPASPTFPARLFEQPAMVFVYGPSSALVNLTLFALASHANPEFHWVEIGALTKERVPCDPVRLGWIPENRVWRVDRPDSFGPDQRSAAVPLSGMIRSDEPSDAVSHFTEFLRLPDTSQQILTSGSGVGKPGVVAVTNADRVEGTFPASIVPAILEVHRRSGFSVMIGYGEKVSPERSLFDFVFRLQGDDHFDGGWKNVELVCEKGVASGPLRVGHAVRIGEIPLLSEIISRAREPR